MFANLLIFGYIYKVEYFNNYLVGITLTFKNKYIESAW